MGKRNDIPQQIYLEEKNRPKAWLNLRALFNNVEPYLTDDDQIVTVDHLSQIFSRESSIHELSNEKYIEIPQQVDELYKMFRATPLHRAYRLEKMLGTPARLYYKYEGVNPSGSHKLNSAIPQVYYNKKEGVTKLVTETGAGQWGTALSVACNMLDVECEVFMVKASAQQKKERFNLIKCFGATVHESPSNVTKAGKAILAKDPNNSGSLGTAITEAIEVVQSSQNAKYVLGSCMNHVVMHQTVIGLETQAQLKQIDEKADMIIACCGGGSNFGGIAFPFVEEKMNGKNLDIIGVEPMACPSITRGRYAYDYSDIGHLTPKMLQYTLGNNFMPPSIHAGGLRFHGMGPLVSKVFHGGLARAVAVKQKEVFKASLDFVKAECILPAPESGHAIAEAIKQALICKESGEEKVIVFNVTGHGQFDTTAYENYFSGKIVDAEYTQEMLQEGFKSIPKTNFKF